MKKSSFIYLILIIYQKKNNLFALVLRLFLYKEYVARFVSYADESGDNILYFYETIVK